MKKYLILVVLLPQLLFGQVDLYPLVEPLPLGKQVASWANLGESIKSSIGGIKQDLETQQDSLSAQIDSLDYWLDVLGGTTTTPPVIEPGDTVIIPPIVTDPIIEIPLGYTHYNYTTTTASTSERWDRIRQNKIHVENNMWNIQGLSNFSGTVETLPNRQFRLYGTIDAPKHPFSIKYYQQLIFGQKLWDKESNSEFFPAPYSKYKSILCEFDWEYASPRGQERGYFDNNVAIEYFLINNPTPNNAAHKVKEVMIWLDGTWEQPSIKYRDVEIGGYKWKVSVSGEYVAFQPQDGAINKGIIDLMDFYNFLISKGEASKEWYIPAIEAGFELIRGDVDFKWNKFELYLKE